MTVALEIVIVIVGVLLLVLVVATVLVGSRLCVGCIVLAALIA